MSETQALHQAVEAIAAADALVFTAGAGMGVDSGLPDFRGNQGFWKAYPPYASKGLSFIDMANPQWFTSNPQFAWGFYGHRLMLYRRVQPHRGFDILKKWGERATQGSFVFTSNVDGQFQKAGFDPERIEEVHGSIHYFQCLQQCGFGIFPAPDTPVEIDEETMMAHTPLPSCPKCGSLARPNILMFGDWGYDGERSIRQSLNFRSWLQSIRGKSLTVVECGAGSAVPTVRMTSESLVSRGQGVLIRINVREPGVPPGQISLPLPALEALAALDEQLSLGS